MPTNYGHLPCRFTSYRLQSQEFRSKVPMALPRRLGGGGHTVQRRGFQGSGKHKPPFRGQRIPLQGKVNGPSGDDGHSFRGQGRAAPRRGRRISGRYVPNPSVSPSEPLRFKRMRLAVQTRIHRLWNEIHSLRNPIRSLRK